MSKNINPIDIIIPTYNNPDMLSQCLSSIGGSRLCYPLNVIVVNNGHPASLDNIGNEPWFKIIQTGGMNLGWEGGLKRALKESNSEFVVFMNDDTFVPDAQSFWLRRMMESFNDKEVAAVGPTSNVVAGNQNMLFRTPYSSLQATYLIGFCMLIKRSALDEVGGIDDTLSGGDDLDLSIRLRKAGHVLVIRRDVFVYHHGFVTGTKLHGGANTIGGWNSPQMTEKVNMELIKKHGFSEWFKCVAGYSYPERGKGDDHEGDIIRKYIVGEKIGDLGCANNKTVSKAIGVDRVPNGQWIPFLNARSEGDVTGDAEKDPVFEKESMDTIICRHLLEHCVDTVKTLNHWKNMVKHKGRLIIAVPNENIYPTIPLNGEHVHAFTPQSLGSLGELVGLKVLSQEGTNGGSFVTVFEKNGIHNKGESK